MSEGFGEPIPIPPLVLRPSPPAPPVEGPPITLPEPPAEPAPAPAPPVVVPPEPTSPEALPDLGVLAALIVLLGLIALASALVDFFNWLARRLLGPLFPRSNTKPLDTQTMLQPLSNALGKWEQGIDSNIGLSFQKLAAMTNRVGRAILAAEQAVYHVAARLAGLSHEQAHQGQRITAAQARAQTAQHAASEAQRQTAVEQHRATQREQALAQQVHGLTHHITHVLEPELEGLRHKIPALEKGVGTAWDEIRKHEEALSIAGVTAATAVALGRLGGDWIRCESNRLLGRANCGSNSDLWRRLLADALPALVATDLCGIAEGVTSLAETLTPALIGFVDAEFALVGCHGADKPGPLRIRGYTPTPVVAAIAA